MISSPKSTDRRVRFSQHFLSDANVLKKIESAMPEMEGMRVAEVGPGKGALTEIIEGKHPQKLILIEKDPKLAESLKERFPQAEIINADALDCDINADVFVSSVPYSITREIILLLCRSNRIGRAYLIIQREVAEKIEKELPLPISVFAGTYFSSRILFDIKRNSFIPPPKVLSSFVMMERTKMFEEGEENYWKFLTLVLSSKKRLAGAYGEKYAEKRIYSLTKKELMEIYADKHLHSH
ncbi:MAG: rRNA adenine dimethyltransferase family protein [bacterium]|nr:rRNA adenine dimethyltransferase family protein [bacterium]